MAGNIARDMKTPHPTITLLILLFMLIGIGLRLAYIARPIYTDEAYTYLYFIQDGLGDVLTDYREPNNHIFQTIFAWLSVALIGNEPFAMRVPALISGIILLPVMYIAGERLYNPRAGVIAMGLVAVSVPLTEYAVSARGYSFIALFFVLQLILAHDLKNPHTHSTVPRWIGYGVLAALGLYTVPIMLYPLGAVSLWLLASIWLENSGHDRWLLTRNLVLSLALGAVLTIALYLPIVRANGVEAVIGNRFVLPLSPEEFRQTVITFPDNFLAFVSQGVPESIHMGLIGIALLGVLFHSRISPDKLPLIVPTVLWLGALVIIQYVLPPIRTWIFLVVVYYLLAGAGLAFLLDMIDKRLPGVFVVVSILLIGVMAGFIIRRDALNHTLTYKVERDAQAAAAFLADQLQPDDRILLTNGAIHNFEYYLDYYGQPFDLVYLTDRAQPDENALQTAQTATLYVLTRVGDVHVADRLRESIGVELNAQGILLEPLATMPANEIIVNRLLIENRD